MAEVIPCDVAKLYAKALSLLDAHDARNNLILGVLRAAAAPAAPNTPFGWEVHDAGRLVGVCIGTPPFPMLISSLPAPGTEAVADAIDTHGLLPTSINGLARVTERVCERMVATHGAGINVEPAEHLRLFELRQVNPVHGVPGKLRVAEPPDIMEVMSFYTAFEREALAPERRMPDVGRLVVRLLAARFVFVWERAGEIVAFATKGREIGGGASIGPVYTPPARRGRGYASALVAGLSQQLLDEGKVYTCLFTDLANPVSNSIYPKLGYVYLDDFCAFQLIRGGV